MTLNEQQLARWSITRQKDKTSFILMNGALGWGLTTAVLYSLLMWLVTDANLKFLLPFALILFPVGGLLWGWCVWTFSERAFHKRD